MDAVILTPISIEYSIVRSFLSNLEVRRISNFTCEIGQFKGKHYTYQIAIRETGSRETAAALVTQSIIEELKPSLLILLGICGGIKDVVIGDVVVGTKAYGYEAGKETPNGFVARPEAYHYDKELIEYIKILQYSFDWKKRSVDSQNAKVIYGPIASGNKVIASKESPIFKQLKLHYNDTTAIEMEAAGFAEAAFKYKNVRILNIRGVSDLLDKKKESDEGGSQKRAVRNAAAFVFELLYQIDFEEFKLMIMTPREVAGSVVSILFPILKLDSIKKIGKEFKEATNGTINDIWEKVRPIFIEEVDNYESSDLKKERTAIKFEGAVESRLKEQLEKKDDFKSRLENLLKSMKENENKNESGISVQTGNISGGIVNTFGSMTGGTISNTINNKND